MYNPPMRVTLGASSLKAYVTAPKTLHVLGIVRFGMEYGLLATNDSGDYFRVNGSRVVELDAERVLQAMDLAHRNGVRAGLGPVTNAARVDSPAPQAAPQVTLRKRRHVELALSA